MLGRICRWKDNGKLPTVGIPTAQNLMSDWVTRSVDEFFMVVYVMISLLQGDVAFRCSLHSSSMNNDAAHSSVQSVS